MITMREEIKREIQRLQPISYEQGETGTDYKAVLRDPMESPTIDEVVEAIVNIFWEEFRKPAVCGSQF